MKNDDLHSMLLRIWVFALTMAWTLQLMLKLTSIGFGNELSTPVAVILQTICMCGLFAWLLAQYMKIKTILSNLKLEKEREAASYPD